MTANDNEAERMANELILVRWKGLNLTVYREPLVDDKYMHIFSANHFLHGVNSDGVRPLLTSDDRDLLAAYMDEHEKVLTS